MTAYIVLFFTSLIAATLIPAQSEAVLTGLLLTHRYSVTALIIVASTGNVLGAVINYGLGRWIEHFRDKKLFPVKPDQLERTSTLYKRYGRWLLLLSWVPIMGDPITVVAGVLRERFILFLILVTFAKVGRYICLAIVTIDLFG